MTHRPQPQTNWELMITVFAYDEPNLKGKKHEGLSGPIVGGFTQSVDVET